MQPVFFLTFEPFFHFPPLSCRIQLPIQKSGTPHRPERTKHVWKTIIRVISPQRCSYRPVYRDGIPHRPYGSARGRAPTGRRRRETSGGPLFHATGFPCHRDGGTGTGGRVGQGEPLIRPALFRISRSFPLSGCPTAHGAGQPSAESVRRWQHRSGHLC